MAGFEETWNAIPYVTRHVGALAIGLFFVFVLNPYWAVLGWRLPQAPIWQVWRFFLAPFSYVGQNVSGLAAVFMFCSTLQTLETSVFRSRSRTVYYLLWLSAGFNLAGPRLGMYAYLNGIVYSMTYTLAQEAPDEKTVYIVIPMQRKYLPLVNIIVGFVNARGALSGAYEAILAIIVAHSYMFFTELLPGAGGPVFFVQPPRVLRALDQMEENERKRGSFGAGRRLGKESWF